MRRCEVLFALHREIAYMVFTLCIFSGRAPFRVGAGGIAVVVFRRLPAANFVHERAQLFRPAARSIQFIESPVAQNAGPRGDQQRGSHQWHRHCESQVARASTGAQLWRVHTTVVPAWRVACGLGVRRDEIHGGPDAAGALTAAGNAAAGAGEAHPALLRTAAV